MKLSRINASFSKVNSVIECYQDFEKTISFKKKKLFSLQKLPHTFQSCTKFFPNLLSLVFVDSCKWRLDWLQMSLHKKWSFPLRISSVNMTKYAEILNWKLHFLCSVFWIGKRRRRFTPISHICFIFEIFQILLALKSN